MSDYRGPSPAAEIEHQPGAGAHRVPGWTTDTELVREFDRPVNVADALHLAVEDAIGQWPELSETPPLYKFVDTDNLNELFKAKATDDSGWLPSAEFQFQGCRVTVLYSSVIRVIIERDP